MAFYEDEDDKLDQQDPNAAPAGQPTSPQSSMISGPSQQASPTNGSAALPASETTPDRSGNFVGLQDYLKANQNQASKLGGQVAGHVEGAIQQSQDEIAQINPKFNELADKGQISNINTAEEEGTNIVTSAATGPQGQELDKDRFKEISNARYQGPNTFQESELFNPAYEKFSKAKKAAELTKDESGSQQLLKDVYKQNAPTYSAGESLFDSYLLNTGENRQKLADARQNAGVMESQWNQAGIDADNYAKTQRDLADRVRENVREFTNTTQATRNKEVQDALDAISATWNDEQTEYANALFNSNEGKNLTLTDDMLQKLGVKEGQRIYNVLKGMTLDDIKNQYVKMDVFDENKVISKDQQAQLAALDELASLYGGELLNKYTLADQAGTMTKDTAFDTSGFGKAVTDAEKAFTGDAAGTNFSSGRRTNTGVGNLYWAEGDVNAADYIAGNPFNVRTHNPIANRPELISDQVAQVNKSLSDQILAYLGSQGYDNKIKRGK
jgi:hypothetical protein